MRIKSKKEKSRQYTVKHTGRISLRGKILLIAAITVILVVVGCRLFSDELELSFHHLYSPKAEGAMNTRILVLADLHSREYGIENSDLIAQIDRLEPDLILMVGDMMSMDDDADVFLNLSEKLTQIAPVYCCLGNHEAGIVYNTDTPLAESLKASGVHLLINQAEEITVNRTRFLIGGLGTPQTYENQGKAFVEEFKEGSAFRILLCHWPDLCASVLTGTEIDLGISGHYHGGQVRLPWIGGLYHKDTGLFPEYSGGMYKIGSGTLFVSRGMGGHSELPRINNPPELAVIDINGRQENDDI